MRVCVLLSHMLRYTNGTVFSMNFDEIAKLAEDIITIFSVIEIKTTNV